MSATDLMGLKWPERAIRRYLVEMGTEQTLSTKYLASMCVTHSATHE